MLVVDLKGGKYWTYMDEACCDNDSSAELFDDGKHNAGSIHLEHLLQNQGRIHSYS